MTRPERTLEKADQPLQDIMGWGKYQASAYRCLVADGPLEAREIVVRTDIHQGRIYDVLDDLYHEGVVTKQDANPTLYDVQNPEEVIGEQKEQFDDKVSQLMETLVPAYEMNFQRTDSSTSSAWILGGQAGTVRKLREILGDAEESIYALEPDPRWYESSDIRMLKSQVEDGVDVKPVIWNARQGPIQDFADYNVPVWTRDSVDKTIYIVDSTRVVMKIDRGNTGVIFSDGTMANVFITEFEASFTKAERFEDNA